VRTDNFVVGTECDSRRTPTSASATPASLVLIANLTKYHINTSVLPSVYTDRLEVTDHANAWLAGPDLRAQFVCASTAIWHARKAGITAGNWNVCASLAGLGRRALRVLRLPLLREE